MNRAAAMLAMFLAFPACKRDRAHPATGTQAVVTAKNGSVQVLRAEDGSVADAKVGDRLSARDALRTGAGEADVAVDGVRMRLLESSRLELKQVANQTVRARVRGSELAAGTIDGNGKLHLKSGWTYLGNTAEGDYSGTLTPAGGTLTGTQTWRGPGGGDAVSRACTVALVPAPRFAAGPRAQ